MTERSIGSITVGPLPQISSKGPYPFAPGKPFSPAPGGGAPPPAPTPAAAAGTAFPDERPTMPTPALPLYGSRTGFTSGPHSPPIGGILPRKPPNVPLPSPG